MFDAFFVRRLKSPLAFAAKPLDAAGIKATQVTLIGAVIGLAAAILIAADALLLGGLLFLMNRLFDGLDGALARQQGPTEQGAFLDITLDFLIYSAIPFAFAVRDPDVALAAAFCCFRLWAPVRRFSLFRFLPPAMGWKMNPSRTNPSTICKD